MNGTSTSYLYRTIGSEEWSHHFYQEQQSIPLERYLLYEYIKIDLYERQLKLGMLSPYTEPFNLAMEKYSREEDITERTNDIKDKTELTENLNNTETKDINIKQPINRESEIKQVVEQIITQIKNEWKQVGYNKTTNKVKNKTDYEKKAKEEDVSQYNILMENDKEEEDEVPEHMKKKVVKEEAIKQKDQGTYKVDEISTEDLDRVLDEYRKKDRRVGELHNECYMKEGNDDEEDVSAVDIILMKRYCNEVKDEDVNNTDDNEVMDERTIASDYSLEREESNCKVNLMGQLEAMQEEIETLQYQYLINLQQLEEYEEIEETLRKKLHELEIGQNEVTEKEEEIKELNNKIKRLGEMETCQEEKEAEWMKRMKEYEDKLAMVDLVLADYDMILEWEEGGVKVYNSMCDEEDEMYESDDSSCDDLIEED